MGIAASAPVAGTATKMVVVATASAATAAAAWYFSSPSDTGVVVEEQMRNVLGDDRQQEFPWAFSSPRDTGVVVEEQTRNVPGDDRQQELPSDPIQGIIKIMSYNVFSVEQIMLSERMEAISMLIQQHSPDVVLLQEVKPNIYEFFRDCEWWGMYECSVKPEKVPRQHFCMLLSKLPVKRFFHRRFESTETGKGVSGAHITTGSDQVLVVATCHLKRPTPTEKYTTERVNQASEAIDLVNFSQNVVLGGDMNWDDAADGPFPRIGRWSDAWSILRPGEIGHTYSTKSNGMMHHSRPLQKRLDRFICKLKDFNLISIDMIGTEAIPGIRYRSKGVMLPVLPSDHYGLLLTISPKSKICKELLVTVNFSQNVVLGGDMNWDDAADGPFPRIGRWSDAWSILRPGEIGHTYSTKSNGMMHHSRPLQKRLDRFICKLKDFNLVSIDMIGTEAIPGIRYRSKGVMLPVLPSDHYGLLLTISPK